MALTLTSPPAVYWMYCIRASPKMQVGDQIVEVNGVDFTNVDHKEVIFFFFSPKSLFICLFLALYMYRLFCALCGFIQRALCITRWAAEIEPNECFLSRNTPDGLLVFLQSGWLNKATKPAVFTGSGQWFQTLINTHHIFHSSHMDTRAVSC